MRCPILSGWYIKAVTSGLVNRRLHVGVRGEFCDLFIFFHFSWSGSQLPRQMPVQLPAPGRRDLTRYAAALHGRTRHDTNRCDTTQDDTIRQIAHRHDITRRYRPKPNSWSNTTYKPNAQARANANASAITSESNCQIEILS